MLLIKNGLIYTMETRCPFHGDLLIKDGKVEKIAENIAPTEKMEVVDAEGLSVFPGFIDAHSHIGISEEKISMQCDESNEGTMPVTPAMRAIDAINPMDSAFHNALAVGITGAERLRTVLTVLAELSNNSVSGQIDSVDVTSVSSIELWYDERFQINLGDTGQLEYKISALKATIDQMESYESGHLDLSFKNWTDKVGYTPFT